MSENNQQISKESKPKLRLEELKDEGKMLTEQEMNQVAGGVGPNRYNVGSVTNSAQLQGNKAVLPGRTIYMS
ncbi:hypothetical protein D3P09_18445 [Paenibacillus pinisoli]|uniref:Uncharacterized protein n=1 Tax=Paenibacillus pinisoli TaxID=1276110 RepID=A0A3A6PC16_9BACL|nr:hypothetical protein [Paenibacillus pinisoli]RJX38057.1 hypothetical protein D3P09_18445 [Paenibacillus pinisoli]